MIWSHLQFEKFQNPQAHGDTGGCTRHLLTLDVDHGTLYVYTVDASCIMFNTRPHLIPPITSCSRSRLQYVCIHTVTSNRQCPHHIHPTTDRPRLRATTASFASWTYRTKGDLEDRLENNRDKDKFRQEYDIARHDHEVEVLLSSALLPAVF